MNFDAELRNRPWKIDQIFCENERNEAKMLKHQRLSVYTDIGQASRKIENFDHSLNIAYKKN